MPLLKLAEHYFYILSRFFRVDSFFRPFRFALCHSSLYQKVKLYELAKTGIDLRVMNEAQLKVAIQRPLQSMHPNTGKRFQDALLNVLARDAGEDAAYLPLLQVTLDDIWRTGLLTADHYTSLSRSKFGVFGDFQSRLQGFWSHLFRFRLQKTTYFISENRPNLTQKLDIDRQICIYVNCLARILSLNLKFGSTESNRCHSQACR
ncbi:hypothetical protein KFU94_19250 [Chloroflexi bacterium TSY]|nr:hypothetical protein [Chloroflexi bacterium TSY]